MRGTQRERWILTLLHYRPPRSPEQPGQESSNWSPQCLTSTPPSGTNTGIGIYKSCGLQSSALRVECIRCRTPDMVLRLGRSRRHLVCRIPPTRICHPFGKKKTDKSYVPRYLSVLASAGEAYSISAKSQLGAASAYETRGSRRYDMAGQYFSRQCQSEYCKSDP